MADKEWVATITLGLPRVSECTFQYYPKYIGEQSGEAEIETWDYLADIWGGGLYDVLEEYIDITADTY